MGRGRGSGRQESRLRGERGVIKKGEGDGRRGTTRGKDGRGTNEREGTWSQVEGSWGHKGGRGVRERRLLRGEEEWARGHKGGERVKGEGERVR